MWRSTAICFLSGSSTRTTTTWKSPAPPASSAWAGRRSRASSAASSCAARCSELICVVCCTVPGVPGRVAELVAARGSASGSKFQAENKIWDHRKETREYCKSDVDILHESMKEYSKGGMETIGIDPLQYTTTASFCFNAYRIKFYDPEQAPICILKPNEWKFIKRSFFGGRTETFQTYRIWTDHELRDSCGGSSSCSV